jgi:5-formyltetrahydrofolate cyclo-ligase
MSGEQQSKAALRKVLRERLAAIGDAPRHARSMTASSFITSSPEFTNARVVMLFLSTPHEVETASIALKAWQAGKTVLVPKVSWDQRRMLPVEITSLSDSQLTHTGPVREPISGRPMPVEFVDLVIVPGLGFTNSGYRIGRGMGFYDRFLAQPEFLGLSCGLAFEEQVVETLPTLDHDMPLSMLATDRGLRRFASNLIQQP